MLSLNCKHVQPVKIYLQFLAHLYELLPSFGVRRWSVNFLKNLLLKPLGQVKPNLA